jgi:hypothetical protein
VRPSTGRAIAVGSEKRWTSCRGKEAPVIRPKLYTENPAIIKTKSSSRFAPRAREDGWGSVDRLAPLYRIRPPTHPPPPPSQISGHLVLLIFVEFYDGPM